MSKSIFIPFLLLFFPIFLLSGLPRVAGQNNNHALNFDGINDRVVTPTLSHGNAFTYEGWFDLNTPNPFFSGLITSFSPSGVVNLVQLTMDASGHAYIEWGDQIGTPNQFVTRIASNTVINNTGPHHVACVYDGVTLSLYVDGVLENDTTINRIISITQPFHIMAERVPSLHSRGSADEIRIWNIARTPTEILANVNSCLTGNEPGLLALYDFEDGPGSNIATDLTPAGNDATLTNMNSNSDWVSGLFMCQAPNQPQVPTLSQWGLILLLLSILAIGTIAVWHRRVVVSKIE